MRIANEQVSVICWKRKINDVREHSERDCQDKKFHVNEDTVYLLNNLTQGVAMQSNLEEISDTLDVTLASNKSSWWFLHSN